jgi:hypothetical protein
LTVDAIFNAAALPTVQVPTNRSTPSIKPGVQTEAVNALTLARGKDKGILLAFPSPGGVANLLKGGHGASV